LVAAREALGSWPVHIVSELRMDDRTISRWRLSTQRLAWRTHGSPQAVVKGLLGVQAENHSQASWAVADRTSGLTEIEFGQLFDDGEILRTHVLRPTWHFVGPEDIGWLVELTAPRVRRTLVQLQRSLELSDAALQASNDAIAKMLSGGVHLTREAMRERLRNSGLPAEGRRFGVMTFHAELSGLICSGARHGPTQTYALVEERAPNTRRLDREEALAALVLRYFTGHGPATKRDLSYWATMSLTDIRVGLAQVADQLGSFEHDGRTYWFGESPPPEEAHPTPRGHLLQVLDEYHHGYQDSRQVLDMEGIVPSGRALSMGMALVDGQMVGDMRRDIRADRVIFEVGLFRDVDEDELGALREAADRCGSFLGLEAEMITTRP
jgi:hypothetical protein